MTNVSMDYDSLVLLRREHPAWRLLLAESAPLVLSTLYKHFVQSNVRVLSRRDLSDRLEDELFGLRENLGEDAYPRNASQYLDDWSAENKGWLRKYYPAGSDEPHYDLTPATEKTLTWLAELQQRHFVGTESRLLTVFELLRQMARGTELDPAARIAELERQRAALDADIDRVKQGRMQLMDSTQVRDRFLQMAGTARALLADFRDVEQNFRALDRSLRERIATWDESRGSLLEAVFGDRDAIEDSDQGRSFRAFWDFLMSPERQEELTALLRTVLSLEAVQSLSPDPRLLRIHYDWLEAGEVAQRTVARLSEQIRRYLDDHAWLDNRRVMQLIRAIEQTALACRSAPPNDITIELDAFGPQVELVMDRPMFAPPFQAGLSTGPVSPGGGDIPIDRLFEQVFVDPQRLAANVRFSLEDRRQASLEEVLLRHPLQQGLAELIGYLQLAATDCDALIDADITQHVEWIDTDGHARAATIPLVIFTRPVVAESKAPPSIVRVPA